MIRLFLACILMLMLWPVAVWADVAALSYTDPENTPQTVIPSKQYINPTGPLNLHLTGGLERKVGYVLTNSMGHTVAQGVSGLISASDTITVLGQTYYGKVLTVPVVLDEGSYTLTGQILDNAGQVVAAQSYPLVADRTAPMAGGIWWHSHYYNNYITGNELVSPYYMFNLIVKEVSDSVGIDHIQF